MRALRQPNTPSSEDPKILFVYGLASSRNVLGRCVCVCVCEKNKCVSCDSGVPHFMTHDFLGLLPSQAMYNIPYLVGWRMPREVPLLRLDHSTVASPML